MKTNTIKDIWIKTEKIKKFSYYGGPSYNKIYWKMFIYYYYLFLTSYQPIQQQKIITNLIIITTIYDNFTGLNVYIYLYLKLETINSNMKHTVLTGRTAFPFELYKN